MSSKAAADYILGTCHKAKGMEEDYVQVADDFAPISQGMQAGVEVSCGLACYGNSCRLALFTTIASRYAFLQCHVDGEAVYHTQYMGTECVQVPYCVKSHMEVIN